MFPHVEELKIVDYSLAAESNCGFDVAQFATLANKVIHELPKIIISAARATEKPTWVHHEFVKNENVSFGNVGIFYRLDTVRQAQKSVKDFEN